jgi:hypothetical protein
MVQQLMGRLVELVQQILMVAYLVELLQQAAAQRWSLMVFARGFSEFNLQIAAVSFKTLF